MANVDRQKSLEDEKVTDDALKQHRVGGRLVTRREVGRSKKCGDSSICLEFPSHGYLNSCKPTGESLLAVGIPSDCVCHPNN